MPVGKVNPAITSAAEQAQKRAQEEARKKAEEAAKKAAEEAAKRIADEKAAKQAKQNIEKQTAQELQKQANEAARAASKKALEKIAKDGLTGKAAADHIKSEISKAITEATKPANAQKVADAKIDELLSQRKARGAAVDKTSSGGEDSGRHGKGAAKELSVGDRLEAARAIAGLRRGDLTSRQAAVTRPTEVQEKINQYNENAKNIEEAIKEGSAAKEVTINGKEIEIKAGKIKVAGKDLDLATAKAYFQEQSKAVDIQYKELDKVSYAFRRSQETGKAQEVFYVEPGGHLVLKGLLSGSPENPTLTTLDGKTAIPIKEDTIVKQDYVQVSLGTGEVLKGYKLEAATIGADFLLRTESGETKYISRWDIKTNGLIEIDESKIPPNALRVGENLLTQDQESTLIQALATDHSEAIQRIDSKLSRYDRLFPEDKRTGARHKDPQVDARIQEQVAKLRQQRESLNREQTQLRVTAYRLLRDRAGYDTAELTRLVDTTPNASEIKAKQEAYQAAITKGSNEAKAITSTNPSERLGELVTLIASKPIPEQQLALEGALKSGNFGSIAEINTALQGKPETKGLHIYRFEKYDGSAHEIRVVDVYKVKVFKETNISKSDIDFAISYENDLREANELSKERSDSAVSLFKERKAANEARLALGKEISEGIDTIGTEGPSTKIASNLRTVESHIDSSSDNWKDDSLATEIELLDSSGKKVQVEITPAGVTFEEQTFRRPSDLVNHFKQKFDEQKALNRKDLIRQIKLRPKEVQAELLQGAINDPSSFNRKFGDIKDLQADLANLAAADNIQLTIYETADGKHIVAGPGGTGKLTGDAALEAEKQSIALREQEALLEKALNADAISKTGQENAAKLSSTDITRIKTNIKNLSDLEETSTTVKIDGTDKTIATGKKIEITIDGSPKTVTISEAKRLYEKALVKERRKAFIDSLGSKEEGLRALYLEGAAKGGLIGSAEDINTALKDAKYDLYIHEHGRRKEVRVLGSGTTGVEFNDEAVSFKDIVETDAAERNHLAAARELEAQKEIVRKQESELRQAEAKRKAEQTKRSVIADDQEILYAIRGSLSDLRAGRDQKIADRLSLRESRFANGGLDENKESLSGAKKLARDFGDRLEEESFVNVLGDFQNSLAGKSDMYQTAAIKEFASYYDFSDTNKKDHFERVLLSNRAGLSLTEDGKVQGKYSTDPAALNNGLGQAVKLTDTQRKVLDEEINAIDLIIANNTKRLKQSERSIKTEGRAVTKAQKALDSAIEGHRTRTEDLETVTKLMKSGDHATAAAYKVQKAGVAPTTEKTDFMGGIPISEADRENIKTMEDELELNRTDTSTPEYMEDNPSIPKTTDLAKAHGLATYKELAAAGSADKMGQIMVRELNKLPGYPPEIRQAFMEGLQEQIKANAHESGFGSKLGAIFSFGIAGRIKEGEMRPFLSGTNLLAMNKQIGKYGFQIGSKGNIYGEGTMAFHKWNTNGFSDLDTLKVDSTGFKNLALQLQDGLKNQRDISKKKAEAAAKASAARAKMTVGLLNAFGKFGSSLHKIILDQQKLRQQQSFAFNPFLFRRFQPVRFAEDAQGAPEAPAPEEGDNTPPPRSPGEGPDIQGGGGRIRTPGGTVANRIRPAGSASSVGQSFKAPSPAPAKRIRKV